MRHRLTALVPLACALALAVLLPAPAAAVDRTSGMGSAGGAGRPGTGDAGDAAARAGSPGAAASRARRNLIAGPARFTGLGFDACAAPSSQAMAAWRRSSPFRAVGIYIGGGNRACSQPNLTASWVSEQVAAGWHLIPTYVGLQATTSSCGSCATINPSIAHSQGVAAADDAVAKARAVAIGPGSPIYNDMEAYRRTAQATSSTLAFLAGWTTRLQALGYVSGVYSSSSSGIADLVSRLGTPYPQPHALWIANWNGRQDTYDPFVPNSAWSDHQRIHQYRGGHNETWGGVTINIDSNYVEGPTAGVSTGSADDPRGRLEAVGSPAPGQVQVSGWAFDPNAPRRPVSIRAVVTGVKDRARSSRYELGPVASQAYGGLSPLPVRAAAPGFNTGFPVVGSGRQRVCVYALNIGPGSDRLLGCRTIGVRIPIVLSNLRTHRNSIQVRVHCVWPAGTQCPGQMLLRTRVAVRKSVRLRGGRRAVRTRIVTRAIGRRAFRLTGGRSHTFRVPLDGRGRQLARARPRLRAQLVVAIPGGRTARPVRMR